MIRKWPPGCKQEKKSQQKETQTIGDIGNFIRLESSREDKKEGVNSKTNNQRKKYRMGLDKRHCKPP